MSYKFKKQKFEYAGDESVESIQIYIDELKAYEKLVSDFKVSHQGLNYYEDDNCIIMYEKHEKIVDGEAIDQSDDEEYKAAILAQENATKKCNLQAQIDDLDKKRIRAIAEPEQKDEHTTWLEYYTMQIQDLRTQIAEL